MIGIDEAIGGVERLYQALTGHDVPKSETPYAPIPAEKDPTKYVEEQLDRLSSLLGQPVKERTAQPVMIPPVTVVESSDEYVVRLDLPGVVREQVHVHQQGGAIHVVAQRSDQIREGTRILLSERPFGAFQRTLSVPPDARSGELSAEMKSGVLELRIKRKPEVGDTPREVPVR